jgi:hypothetical protein
MTASPFLRPWTGGGRSGFTYWCQGCETLHSVVTAREDSQHPCWGFNGNMEKPTFTPSVLVTSGHYMPGHDPAKGCYCTKPPPDGEDWGFKCERCHTFITDGQVQFLSDCTHALAGQTLPLPELPPRA